MIIKLSGINKFNGESLENHTLSKDDKNQWYYNNDPLSEKEVLSFLKSHDQKSFQTIRNNIP